MLSSGKAEKSIFHLFSVLCPIGVNTGQENMTVEWRGGRQVPRLVLCLPISPQVESRAEQRHGDKATGRQERLHAQNSLGLWLPWAVLTPHPGGAAPADALAWLGAAVYLESHDPHDLVGYR